ncbi:MAG: hypothetical protein B7Z08_04365 [Sphingomonadales bacterium 32-68-7]|nr:MAG: hypothetical protein B7Z33_04790 [Sphingomonadales bacterium 12-68-11]OYX09652.1 MAG: hypothetical protein B7Z08_04365 [Sphingomonadales bacterium 32-68-7]
MRTFFASLVAPLALGALIAAGAVAPAAAQQQTRGDQERARAQMQAGRALTSREIEQRIMPQMRGHDYLGFEFDDRASAYRLKYMKDGQVTWVDVDARTGRVLRISK